MVLQAEPLARAVEKAAEWGKPFVVGTTPQGVPLTQEVVETLSAQERLCLGRDAAEIDMCEQRVAIRRHQRDGAVGGHGVSGAGHEVGAERTAARVERHRHRLRAETGHSLARDLRLQLTVEPRAAELGDDVGLLGAIALAEEELERMRR